MSRFAQSVLSLHRDSALEGAFKDAGIPVARLELGHFRDLILKSQRIMIALKQLRDCDLLNGVMYHGCLIATLSALSGSKIPLVWNIRHSLDNWEQEKTTTRQVIRVLAKLSRRADRIIYDSNRSKKQHGELGYAQDNAVLIPNGVDTAKFQPDANWRAFWRRHLNLPEGSVVIGHVARPDPIKAHPIAFAAAETVASRNANAHFVFVGMDRSTPLAQRFLESSSHGKRFFFLGERDDVHTIMPALDLFWLTSVSESHPNVILEAMSCGVPCLATEVGDVRAMIGDPRRIAPVNDIGRLAAAILDYFVLSEAERAALGQTARTTVIKNFSLSQMAHRYAEIYHSLLQTGGCVLAGRS
jgi:glycosyltransferase involved in cell wall biosynthesis